MKILGWLRCFGLALSLAATIRPVAAQEARYPALSREEVNCSSSLRTRGINRASNLSSSSKGVVREIEDAGSGACWQLFRNERHPEGPGRLVLKRSPNSLGEPAGCASGLEWKSSLGSVPSRKFLILAGDLLTVREDSSRASVQLAGVALGPASAGDCLNVRLSVGGRVVRAIAVASGLATLPAQYEAWP